MKKSVAIVACSNGLGHVRRCLLLSEEIIKLGLTPTLFAPINKFKYLVKILELELLPKIINFNSETSSLYYAEDKINELRINLKDLSRFNLVISDNLIEILDLRPDAIILGSFFWHKSLSNISKYKYDMFEKLIFKNKPRVISSELFAPDYITEMRNFKSVGLFVAKNKIKKEFLNRKGILISPGTGGNAISIVKNFIHEIRNIISFKNYVIFLDKSINFLCEDNNFVKADFSKEMYSNLSCAIIRPGIGTITDALYNGVKIYCIFEEQNLEMRNNFNKLHAAGLIENKRDFNEIIKSISEYTKDNLKIKAYLNKIKKLNFSGSSQTAKFILKEL